MTVTLGIAVALVSFHLLEHRGRGRAFILGCGLGLLPISPVPAIGLLAAAGFASLRGRVRSRRLASETAEDDMVLLADLVALGLRAGLGLVQALELATLGLDPGLAAEVRLVVRTAGRTGTAAALARASGRAERLYRLAARAAATGAPLAEAVEAFAAERRHADHAKAVEVARRLPVRMLVPLALLILPGFVVLAVGPALLEALERLQLAP